MEYSHDTEFCIVSFETETLDWCVLAQFHSGQLYSYPHIYIMHAHVANFDILCAAEIRNHGCVWVCVCVDRRLFQRLLHYTAPRLVDRTGGRLLYSLSLSRFVSFGFAHKCNQTGENREKERESTLHFAILLNGIVETHVKRCHLNICVYYRALRWVSFFTFYSTSTRQVLCVTGYGWLAVCLYVPSRRFVALYICTGFIVVCVRVQVRSELHSSRSVGLAGWLAGWWRFLHTHNTHTHI